MHILFKTDTGRLRVVESQDISYVDGTEADSCEFVLKHLPDFTIKVGMNIRDFLKVLNGEAKFFDLYKFEGQFEEHPGFSLQESGKLKNEEADPEDLDQVKKEFFNGKKLNTVESLTTEVSEPKEEKKVVEKEIPTFSKKRKQDKAKVIEKLEDKPQQEILW